MEKEYKELRFHIFKTSERFYHQRNRKFEESSKFAGIVCISCKENCNGYKEHKWRHSCAECGCAIWNHYLTPNLIEHPFQRIGVEEEIPPLVSEYESAVTDGYDWYPRGILESQLNVYMRKFDVEKVPKTNTVGSNYRARQIVYQLPKQDFQIHCVKHINDGKSIDSFEEMRKRKIAECLGVGGVCGAVSSNIQCSGCGSNIKSGAPAVFADKIGDQFVWHPECFKCCVDNEGLVDLIYFCWERKLYCGRHWSEQFKPRCSGCDELIYVGKYTKTGNKSWHMDHFRCWKCNVNLTGQKYLLVGENHFCYNCYKANIANKCHTCSEPIICNTNSLLVGDHHFHKECLVCSQCRTSLVLQKFTFVNNNPICNGCRGIDPERIHKCFSCSRSLTEKDQKVASKFQYYHLHCFTCEQCNKQIESTTYIMKSDGKRFCDPCFKLTAKACSKCSDYIKGSMVSFEGAHYHSKCFNCTDCNGELGGATFYKQEGQPYCEYCYINTYAKRCVVCCKCIAGNTKFVEHEKKYWHSICFCCFKCKKQLAGSQFVMVSGNQICIDCKDLK